MTRSEVLHWVAALIDYGKGRYVPELEKITTMGEIADKITEAVLNDSEEKEHEGG